jgi:anti-sigma factor RsiW
MKSSHDELEELLPAYARGRLSPGEAKGIEAHIEECRDCREALSVLTGLYAIEVPDPGDAFWKTLPRKVRLGTRKEQGRRFSIRSLLLTYLPLAVAAATVWITVSMHQQKQETARTRAAPFFNDAFIVDAVDSGGIREGDLQEIAGSLPPGRVYADDGCVDYGYYAELASLSREEMERFAEALKKDHTTGG